MHLLFWNDSYTLFSDFWYVELSYVCHRIWMLSCVAISFCNPWFRHFPFKLYNKKCIVFAHFNNGLVPIWNWYGDIICFLLTRQIIHVLWKGTRRIPTEIMIVHLMLRPLIYIARLRFLRKLFFCNLWGHINFVHLYTGQYYWFFSVNAYIQIKEVSAILYF